MDNDDLKKLHTLIKGIKTAMLTTIDDHGALRSRPMGTMEVDDSHDLWFFTQLDSPKVAEIAREMQVNVSYSDPGDNRYVSVSGLAQTIRDRAKIKELWKPAYVAFFPEGVDDPNLALLRVTAYDAEYWTGPTNFLGKALRFTVAAIRRDPAPLGENAKLHLA